MKPILPIFTLASVLSLSACGGGSDSTPPDDNTGNEPENPPTTEVTLIANDDNAETDNADTLTVDVAANDEYNGDGELTANLNEFYTDAGDFEFSGTVLTYTPDTDFTGEIEVPYTITDGDVEDDALVYINVTAAEEEPPTGSEVLVANDDYYRATSGNPQVYRYNVRVNDEYTGDGELSLTIDGYDEGIYYTDTEGSFTAEFQLEEDFVGTTTLDYTISDGTHSDSATLYIDVTEVQYDADTLTIVGRAPADSVITTTIAGKTYETQVEPDKFYELGPISAPETPSDSAIRLTSRGVEANGEAHIEHTALFGDFETILEKSGGTGALQSGNSSNTNLSALTTAEDILISRLANADTFSATELADYRASLDTMKLLRFAGAMWLLEKGEHPLPAGYDTVREFALDESAFNDFMASVDTEIHPAVKELLFAPYVMVARHPFGYYLGKVYGNPTIGVETTSNINIGHGESTDSISIVQSGAGVFDAEIWEGTVEEKFAFDETGVPRAPLFNVTAFNDYSGNTYNAAAYDDLLEPEVIEAMKAYFADMQNTITFKYSQTWSNSYVVTNDGYTASILHDVEHAIEPWSFEWEGETYDIPRAVYLSYKNVTTRITQPREYAAGEGEFDFAENPTWVMPVKGKSLYADAITQPPMIDVNIQWGGSDIITFEGQELSGTFTGTYLDISGSWSLDSERKILTLDYFADGNQVETQLWLHHRGAVTTSASVSTLIDEGSSDVLNKYSGMKTWQLARIAPYNGPQPSLVSEIAPNKPLANFFMPHPGGWSKGDPVISSTTQFSYLDNDGTIDNVEVFCGAESIYAVSQCPASDVNLNITNNDGNAASRVWNERSDGSIFFASESYPAEPDRFIEPINFDPESGAVLMMQYAPNSSGDCTVDSCPMSSYPSLRIYKGMDEVTIN
jgi:hypothetical protein